ncbi:hypothetical protein MATL_G00088630 [Megalops atlanticus]|uniref:Uncharacterized protein n=1 Tax=Megalops atlanticus TaxID=7932 RepID=A0A9D3Q6Q1_MEGAT|nr:hypothetical protein MATL_G00088630 [Megalops atlanticus]
MSCISMLLLISGHLCLMWMASATRAEGTPCISLETHLDNETHGNVTDKVALGQNFTNNCSTQYAGGAGLYSNNTNTREDGDWKSHLVVIVAGSAGGATFLLFLLILCICLACKSKKQTEQVTLRAFGRQPAEYEEDNDEDGSEPDYMSTPSQSSNGSYINMEMPVLEEGSGCEEASYINVEMPDLEEESGCDEGDYVNTKTLELCEVYSCDSEPDYENSAYLNQTGS